MSINILDIGTGSGCILLSILKELKLSRGIGIDSSAQAIKIAKVNSKNLNLSNRSKFKALNLNNYNVGKYDLIVSNPPYIASKDIKNLNKDIINHEPKSALDGGVDGLDLIKKVIYKSNYLLKRNGVLALEIGFKQYQKVSDLLKHYRFREMSKEYDYKHNVRCIISTKVDFF
jgi:release factor glutamine methyltransferase